MRLQSTGKELTWISVVSMAHSGSPLTVGAKAKTRAPRPSWALDQPAPVRMHDISHIIPSSSNSMTLKFTGTMGQLEITGNSAQLSVFFDKFYQLEWMAMTQQQSMMFPLVVQFSMCSTPSSVVAIPAEPPSKKIWTLEDAQPSPNPTIPTQNPVHVEPSGVQNLARRAHEVQEGQIIVTYVKLSEFPEEQLQSHISLMAHLPMPAPA